MNNAPGRPLRLIAAAAAAAAVAVPTLAACREAIDKSLSMWAGGFRIRSCWK